MSRCKYCNIEIKWHDVLYDVPLNMDGSPHICKPTFNGCMEGDPTFFDIGSGFGLFLLVPMIILLILMVFAAIHGVIVC